MKNYKITIEYDGTNYAGWQRQKNGVSVQEKIEDAIFSVTRKNIKIIGSSRTDAGVHAKGQVANFYLDTRIPVSKIPMALNSHLPEDIVILSAEEMPDDFHARYCSRGKSYTYTIMNRKIPPAYLRNYMAFCSYDLDIGKMKDGASYILGCHDFSAFKSSGSSVKTSVRTVKRLDVVKNGDIIKIYIEADGFLYNMVRIIAGTLIEVGRGTYPPEHVKAIIESKDRKLAGKTACAKGLCLEKVFY